MLYDNIEQLLINFFEDHPDGKQISTNEQKSYIRTIREYAAEAYVKQYEEFNRTLCSKAIWHGIDMMYEGCYSLSEQKDHLAFNCVPREWK